MTKSTSHSPSSILHNINYAKLWMNLSNAPFCNLYNRKYDFSPLRAAWRPDFFVMGLCSPFALRYAGRLQAGTQDSWCLLPRAALRACLPVQCWRFYVPAGLPRRSAGVCSVWPQIWRFRAAARLAAQLRPRSATATVLRRIWLAPWVKLSMRNMPMDLTMNGRGALMVQRLRQQPRPDDLRHVCALAARQRRVAACRRHRPRCARWHCKSITMCVPGRARVRLPALSLLPGMP